MNEEYYRCVGYCVIDADSGRCGSCGRPAEPISDKSKITKEASFSSRGHINGAGSEKNRFPTDLVF